MVTQLLPTSLQALVGLMRLKGPEISVAFCFFHQPREGCEQWCFTRPHTELQAVPSWGAAGDPQPARGTQTRGTEQHQAAPTNLAA